MSGSPLVHDRIQIASLMNIASALSEYTSSPESCARIPAFLSSALGIETLSLALIRDAADDVHPHFICCAASGTLSSGSEPLQSLLLHLHRKTFIHPLSDLARAKSALHPGSDVVSLGDLTQVPAFPRARVFAHTVDASHRVLLTIHLRAAEADPEPKIDEQLSCITGHLASPLHCLLTLLASPDSLGEPFSNLTDREWVVLRNLDSEVGEKELAVILNLSHHTLHSHIKSIYRKTGVQGRIGLLLRFRAAVARMRMDALIRKSGVPASQSGSPVKIAG